MCSVLRLNQKCTEKLCLGKIGLRGSKIYNAPVCLKKCILSTNKKRKENKANPNFYTKIVFHLQDNSDEMTAPEHEHQY